MSLLNIAQLNFLNIQLHFEKSSHLKHWHSFLTSINFLPTRKEISYKVAGSQESREEIFRNTDTPNFPVVEGATQFSLGF